MDGIKTKSLQAVGWSALSGWSGQIIGLIVFASLARLLDPADFGMVAMATIFIQFIQLFVNQGMVMALVQRQDLQPAHLDSAFWTTFIAGLVFTVCCVLFSDEFAQTVKMPDIAPVISALSLILVIKSLASVQQAILERELQYKSIAIATFSGVLAGGLVGVSMAFWGFGVWSLVGQQVVMAAVQVVIIWRIGKWRPSLRFSFSHFKDLFSYGVNVIGINFTEFINRQADNFLVGYFLGPVALGYYTLAYKLFQTVTSLLTGVTSKVAFSSFSALQKQLDRMREAFYLVTEMTSVFSFPIFIGLAVLAPQVIPLLFGADWEKAVPVIQVLALVGILESVYYFNANVIMAMGKPSWRLKVNILNAIVNLIAFSIAVRWGIVAVAAAYVIRAYLLSPLPLYLVKKLIDIEFLTYLKKLTPQLISGIFMAVALVYLRSAFDESALPLAALTAVLILGGVVAYGSAMFFVSPDLPKRFLDLGRSLKSRKQS